MRKETDIVHENATHWVSRERSGDLYVWRTGDVHSVRVAVFGRGISSAVFRAIADADRRDAALRSP